MKQQSLTLMLSTKARSKMALASGMESEFASVKRLKTHLEAFEIGKVRPCPLQGLDAAPPQFQALVEALQMFLPTIGQGQSLTSMALFQDGPDAWTLTVHGAGFGVSTGVFNEFPYSQDAVPRFRLFLIKTVPSKQFGRMQNRDVTVFYARSAGKIVETIGGVIARTASRQVFQYLQERQQRPLSSAG